MNKTSTDESQEISVTEPDWSREKIDRWCSPPEQLLKSIREYQQWQAKQGLLATFFCQLYITKHRFWSVVTGADIPLNCQIAGGLKLTHPNGVVIHPKASIGPNCLILQQVTIVADVSIGGNLVVKADSAVDYLTIDSSGVTLLGPGI